MAEIPQALNTTVAAIWAGYQKDRESEPVRAYLGASEVGDFCERKIWYGFRWAKLGMVEFTGEKLKIFERGKREEPVLIRDLERAGIKVMAFDQNGQQFEFVMFEGHMGGHLDAMLHDLPEAPKTWHVGEFKTHKDERWNAVVKKGVRLAEPKHFAQCQLYMGKTGVTRCAYFAVNKNDERIHMERIEFDRAAFDELVERSKRVIFSEAPPPRISERADWWQCRSMCDYRDICHQDKLPQVTCRSCAHTTPLPNGKWECVRNGVDDLSVEQQQKACGEHRYIPIFFDRFATISKASDEDNWVEYEHRTLGHHFINGKIGNGGRSSEQLRRWFGQQAEKAQEPETMQDKTEALKSALEKMDKQFGKKEQGNVGQPAQADQAQLGLGWGSRG